MKDLRKDLMELSLYIKNQDSTIITCGYDWKDKDSQFYISNTCQRLNLLPKIIEEHKSTTTRENALYSKQKIDRFKKEIEEVDVIGGSSQTVRMRRYFKRAFGNGHKMKFYAAPEGLKIAIENLPFEILKYLVSLCPDYIDQTLTMKLTKLLSRT